MKNNTPSREVISCGCAVIRTCLNRPQILLVNSGFNKYWGIPKGHREVGEANIDCAVRETLEETGIVARVVCELPTVATNLRNNEFKTLFSFLAFEDPDNQIITGDGENEAIDFFDIDAMPQVTRWQLPIVTRAVQIIKNALVDFDEQFTKFPIVGLQVKLPT
jgi:8-oxo-dGTP pyrophosphatase MutT (NUDIX family)